MAAVEDVKGFDEDNLKIGEIEREVLQLQGKSDDEKLEYLLSRQAMLEKEDQRADDIARDHGIRLFSRQKKQGFLRIFSTIVLLSMVYGVQLVALYNLNRSSSIVETSLVQKWIERGIWAPTSPTLNVSDSYNLPLTLREYLGGSELEIFGLSEKGLCLTRKGRVDTAFNVVIGLMMIYMFLFFDLWFVIFDMPLVRNDAGTLKGNIMLLGVVWLVLMNSAVITWLGVISGFSVIANSGDFYSVLFTSLQLFIILVIDDAVLPAVRFLIEEAGRLDKYGNLEKDDLFSLTHGAEYYKPGYGHSFVKIFKDKTETYRKIIAVIAFIAMSTIIFAPAIVTVVYAVQTFVPCP